MSLREKEMGV